MAGFRAGRARAWQRRGPVTLGALAERLPDGVASGEPALKRILHGRVTFGAGTAGQRASDCKTAIVDDGSVRRV
jgi:hypothetical protein